MYLKQNAPSCHPAYVRQPCHARARLAVEPASLQPHLAVQGASDECGLQGTRHAVKPAPPLQPHSPVQGTIYESGLAASQVLGEAGLWQAIEMPSA